MIKVLGLFVFFGLTGLILWSFNEMLWRVGDEEVSDTRPSGGAEQRENTQDDADKIETNSAPRTVQ